MGANFRMVTCVCAFIVCATAQLNAQCPASGSEDFNDVYTVEEAGWEVVDKAFYQIIDGRAFFNANDLEIPNQPRRCVTLTPQIGLQDFWFEVDVWFLGERSGIFIPIRGVGAHQYTYLNISGANGGCYCDGLLCLRSDYIVDDIVYHGDPFAQTPNPFPFSPVVPLRVRVEAQGMHYKAIINGELMLEGDAFEYARCHMDWWGRPGFGATWDIGAWFDNAAWGPLDCETVPVFNTKPQNNRRETFRIESATATADNRISVTAAFPSDGAYAMQVSDVQGRCIANTAGHARKGAMAIEIPGDRMHRGAQVYVVSLRHNGAAVSTTTISK